MKFKSKALDSHLTLPAVAPQLGLVAPLLRRRRGRVQPEVLLIQGPVEVGQLRRRRPDSVVGVDPLGGRLQLPAAHVPLGLEQVHVRPHGVQTHSFCRVKVSEKNTKMFNKASFRRPLQALKVLPHKHNHIQ